MELFKEVNNDFGTNYQYNTDISWIEISSIVPFPMELFDKYKYHLFTSKIIELNDISEEFIEKYKDIIDWKSVSIYKELSEEFIEKYSEYIQWDKIGRFQYLSSKFIKKHIDKLNFYDITMYQYIPSEDLMEYLDKHKYDELIFYRIVTIQKLSEKFIKRYAHILNWNGVFTYQKMSEKLIDKFCDYLTWPEICQYQKLSEEFIEKHINDIIWYYISKYQKLSESFIRKHKTDLDLKCIIDNWLYKSTDEKKQAVIDTGKYECHDDYFIAYKAIRGDRYSLYNFQYKYEKGSVYESWCDCSDNENSFGLNVGTEKFAKDYGKTMTIRCKVIKCKVRYEDVGRIVYDGDKIRCFKIEILN